MLTNNANIQDDEHKVFVDYLKQAAPGPISTNQYFDLIRNLLEVINIKGDDLRLAMTTPNHPATYFLTVIINRRRVIFGYYQEKGELQYTNKKGKPSIAICYKGNYQNTLKGAGVDNNFAYLDSTEEFLTHKAAWIDFIREEKHSATRTAQRESHQPAFYQAVVDLNYRESLLNEIWQPSEDYVALRDALGTFLSPDTSDSWQNTTMTQELLTLNSQLFEALQSIHDEITKRHK